MTTVQTSFFFFFFLRLREWRGVWESEKKRPYLSPTPKFNLCIPLYKKCISTAWILYKWFFNKPLQHQLWPNSNHSTKMSFDEMIQKFFDQTLFNQMSFDQVSLSLVMFLSNKNNSYANDYIGFKKLNYQNNKPWSLRSITILKL